MTLKDRFIKKFMYMTGSSIKNKHVDAFFRYGTIKKFVNLMRVEIAIKTGKTSNFGYPYMLTVEPTNRCNLQCPLCPTGKGLKGRKLQNLDVESFERTLKELGKYVYMINFQNWGEPLIASQTPQLIEIAHKEGIATTIATNGNYPSRINRQIVESGLDNIVFAMDGATQDTYEQYRVNGKIETLTNNIKELVKIRKELKKKSPYIEAQILVFEHNEHQIEAISQLAKDCDVDGLLIRAAVAPGNSKNRKKFYTWNEEENYCRRFWYTASINSDLGVTPCCNFFYKSDDLGSLAENNFSDLWNGPSYVSNRKAVANHDYSNLHMNCKNCKKYNGNLGRETYGVTNKSTENSITWINENANNKN